MSEVIVITSGKGGVGGGVVFVLDAVEKHDEQLPLGCGVVGFDTQSQLAVNTEKILDEEKPQCII